jgi:hypothetical protein|tara:strand:+ start:517 stop:804 length:288 start_codon:yes stop_codon:yes gene_type:complete
MANKQAPNDLVRRILKQISGDLTEKDKLIPEVAVDGSGDIWCWDPAHRIHKKIYRGIKAFIIQENFDDLGRTLIYTMVGDMVCIEPDDLIHTGYD